MARVRLTFRWLSPVRRPYSSSLLCFLYCFDDDSRKRLKTVDSVPQRRCPGLRRLGGQAAGAARRPMAVRIGYRETGLRRAEPAGGSRHPVKRVWIPRRDVAKRLELLPRRVGFAFHMLATGTKPEQVQELLGYKSAKTVRSQMPTPVRLGGAVGSPLDLFKGA